MHRTAVKLELYEDLDELVSRTADLCFTESLTPTEAARKAFDASRVNVEDLYFLAVIGLGKLTDNEVRSRNNIVQNKAPVQRGYSRPKKLRAVSDQQAEQIARRAELFNTVCDALQAVYQGADGKMRALAQFTVNDHRTRLSQCEQQSKSWRKASRFHQEALALLKAGGVECISALPREDQDRLRGLLR